MTAIADLPRPNPPHFHRLKRWTTVGFAIAVGLVALRWWWGYEAERRFEALVAAAHARGERITTDDFSKAPAVSDANNAAIPLKAAAAAVKASTTQQDLVLNDFEFTLPVSKAEAGVVHEIAYANTAPLAQARLASPRTQADYGLHVTSPVCGTLLPDLSPAGQLHELQLYAAIDAHLSHNDAGAIGLLRDADHHMTAINYSQPFLVVHYFSVRRQTITARLAAQLAAELDVAGPSAATTRPAAREDIRALIEQLLDDRALRQSAREAFDGERLMALDTGPSMAATMQPQWLAKLLAPMYLLDSLRSVAYVEPYRTACTQPNYQAARQLAPLLPSTSGRSGLHATVVALPGYFWLLKPNSQIWQYHGLAARRGAALALAIRLYKLDHGGKLPARLDDLVPEYCSALPADPFSPTNNGFIYHPQSSPPLLYSVGLDGVDDHGQRADAKWWESIKKASPDFPIPLTPAIATTQPAATRSGS